MCWQYFRIVDSSLGLLVAVLQFLLQQHCRTVVDCLILSRVLGRHPEDPPLVGITLLEATTCWEQRYNVVRYIISVGRLMVAVDDEKQ